MNTYNSKENYHLRDIERIVKIRLKIFENEIYWLPTFGNSINDAIQDGTPLVLERVSHEFSYLIVEKGKIWEEKSTSNPDEILFWIFKAITFSISNKYAAKVVSDKSVDDREVLFKKQVELLEQLEVNKIFIDQLKSEYNNLLNKNLFKLM